MGSVMHTLCNSGQPALEASEHMDSNAHSLDCEIWWQLIWGHPVPQELLSGFAVGLIVSSRLDISCNLMCLLKRDLQHFWETSLQADGQVKYQSSEEKDLLSLTLISDLDCSLVIT